MNEFVPTSWTCLPWAIFYFPHRSNFSLWRWAGHRRNRATLLTTRENCPEGLYAINEAIDTGVTPSHGWPTDGPALWHRRWCTHVGMEQTLTLQDRGGLPGGGVFTEQVYSCSTKMFPFFGEISPLFAVSGWSYSFRSSRRGECKGRWYNIFDAMWDVKNLLSIGKSSRQCFWFNSSKSAHFLWPGWSWPCASPGKKPSHLL